MKRLKRKKITPVDVICTIAMVFFALVFLTCVIYLGLYAYESYQNRQSGELTADRYVSVDSEAGSGLTQPDIIWEDPEDDTWKKSLPLVDFDALRAASPSVCGWIQVSGLDAVNYPIVWRADNDYYLTHTWDGQDSRYGAIFLDKGCANDLKDAYTLIYGHNMKDGSMFGSLKKYQDASFFEENGGLITLSLPDRTCIYQIFSVRIVSADASSAYTLGYAHDEMFGDYLEYMVNHSLYDTGVEVNQEDTVITLSTCSGNDRLVLHAKLVCTVAREEIESFFVE